MVEWIEIPLKLVDTKWPWVSTLVVEWIEIPMKVRVLSMLESPPSWWSGLKFRLCYKTYLVR